MIIAIAVMAACVPCAAEFKAAAASRIVTPDPLLPLSGGVGQPNPATQKKGDLAVRALVLEQDGTRVAIVAGDFLGFPGVLCNRVRAQVKGIPPENILIGSAHCHSAPDMYGFPDEQGRNGADLKYIEFVVNKMAEAVNEAVGKLQPASIKVNTDKAAERMAYNYYAPQLYDRRMSVIQAVAADGKPIATLVNYASHPEIIGNDQGILSPDFVGPMCDRIAEKGGGMGIYMNSAQGGMVTADCRDPKGGDKDVQTWDECIRIGNLMADEAIRIVANAPAHQDPHMMCKATTIKFPIDSPLLKAVLKGSPLGLVTGEGGTADAQMNVINLADAQILTIPGEALPNIGFYLKRNMNGKQNLLFGLTNDAFGYMLARVDWKSFERYDYISRTCLGENTGEILMEEGIKFVKSCPKPVAD
jgi:hypothetical protein